MLGGPESVRVCVSQQQQVRGGGKDIREQFLCETLSSTNFFCETLVRPLSFVRREFR